jgi:hypothetical protein
VPLQNKPVPNKKQARLTGPVEECEIGYQDVTELLTNDGDASGDDDANPSDDGPANEPE